MAIVCEDFGSYMVPRPLPDVEEVSPIRHAPDSGSDVLDIPGTPMRQRARGEYIGVDCLREVLVDVVGVAKKRDDKSAGSEKEGRLKLLRGKRLMHGLNHAVRME